MHPRNTHSFSDHPAPMGCSSKCLEGVFSEGRMTEMGHSAYRPPRHWNILPSLREEEGEIHMARRTLYLPVMIAATVAVACAAALLAISQKADAAFPGKNGRIAYSAFCDRTDDAIYTIDPGGGGKTKVTRGYQPSYSPNGKRIAYTLYKPNAFQSDIYTIDAFGGGKSRVTNTDNAFERGPSWGSRP